LNLFIPGAYQFSGAAIIYELSFIPNDMPTLRREAVIIGNAVPPLRCPVFLLTIITGLGRTSLHYRR